jgi:hypothetical protein
MTETLRRPDLFVPLSVRFATGSTGIAIQNKFGLEGLAVWVAFLAACKTETVPGTFTWASEPEAWGKLGLTGHEPAFTFDEFLDFTGRRKLTRRPDRRHTRTGRVQHAHVTVWKRWHKEARTAADRERKARIRAENKRDTEQTPSGYPQGRAADLDLELELEVKPPLPPLPGGVVDNQLTRRELRRYTGCRRTRGTHGTGWKRDPLGTDKPPPDWPYDRPTLEEVLAAQTRPAAKPEEDEPGDDYF